MTNVPASSLLDISWMSHDVRRPLSLVASLAMQARCWLNSGSVMALRIRLHILALRCSMVRRVAPAGGKSPPALSVVSGSGGGPLARIRCGWVTSIISMYCACSAARASSGMVYAQVRMHNLSAASWASRRNMLTSMVNF